MYRAGGQEEDDEERSDADEEREQELGIITAAHYDVMAEVVTKLLVNRPSWISETAGTDFQVSRQKLTEATQFIDYDMIDQVEREEEEGQQIMIQQTSEDGGASQADTLESQSRVQSKDNYQPQIHKMNILEKLEGVYEQRL